MKITDIIEELRKINVGIKIKNEQLVLSGGKDKISNELLTEIKENKQNLIDYIKSYEKQSVENISIEEDKNEYYALTAQQQSIWLTIQNPNTVILYNQPSMFKVTGKLNINALKFAIKKIVDNHCSLRTAFTEIKGVPKQTVFKDVEIKIDCLELKESEDINDIYKKFSAFIFNLGKPPLFKFTIIKGNKNEYYLLLNIHHIISDGWSVNIFLKELLDNYTTFLENGNNGGEYISSDYNFREYVKFQNQYINSDKGKEILDFWKGKIGNEYSPSNLSVKTNYEEFDYYDGEDYNCYLPVENQKEIINYCKNKKITQFHFYASVFTLLLKKYTGKDNISFGTPFGSRSEKRFNNEIGCFINTLPIIISLEDVSTFEDLLESVGLEITEVYNRQNYPAEKIVENINMSKTKDGSPLFDIIFVYQNYSLNDLVAGDFEMSYVETPIEKCKAGLVLRIFEDNNKLLLNIEYSKKLFDRYFIEQMFGHFKTILQNILANLKTKVEEIEYLTKEEKEGIINLLNNSNVKYPTDETILDYLNKQFVKNEDKIAITVNNQSFTYGDLNKKSDIIANYLLKDLKIKPNEIVGIETGRNENLIIGILAILKTGSAYLPINPDYPETRKKYMLENSGCNIVLKDDTIKNSNVIYVSINEVLKGNIFYHNEVKVKVKQSNAAYIIYTSGSTGKPKGVVVTHKNLLRLFFNEKPLFDFNENDVWILFFSYAFDFSVWEIFGALLFGGRLVIVTDEITKEPLAFYNILEKEKITILNQTPSAFYRLLIDKEKILSLRYIIFGGETLQPAKLKEWKQYFPEIKIINMYGITETTIHVTYKEFTIEDINTGISNIGKPIPTLGICILDEKFRILPKGIIGQICVYGEGLAQGYLNQPELTKEKFINIKPFGLCYLSGDVGRILGNGDVEYLERMDDQVQFHGFRIELSEIEKALIGINGIKEAVVLAVGSGSDISLNAFLVLEKEMSNDTIRQELTNKIPYYMIPSSYSTLKTIPLTPNGKTDKQTLLKLKSTENKKIIKPANDVEKKVLNVWKEILGNIEISTDESFYVIGGDSIKALKLVRELNKTLNVGLTIAGLYENDTIQKIAGKTINNIDLKYETEVQEELKRITKISNDYIISNNLSQSIEQILPMSDIQRGMIYYSVKNPGSAIYHDQFVYQIYLKDFSLDIFTKAFELMVNKHDMLRTSFNLFDLSEDVQVIHKIIPYKIQYEDLAIQKVEFIEKTVDDYIADERTIKFNISEPPLWRMKIYKAQNDIVIICWAFHHALLDGWSNASLITELFTIYKNLILENLYKPDMLQGKYINFIAEQNVIKNNKEIINYWKAELADFKRLELPKMEWDDNKSPDGEFYLPIETSVMNELKKIALDLSTDIKTVLFTAYLYSISVFTYEKDLLVGVVTNNRPLIEDSEKILGCFLNTVPFRITINSNLTWREFIADVIAKTNIQKKYEGLSLFEIVKNLEIPVGEANPLFDVFYNYVDFNIYENVYNDISLDRKGIDGYNINGFGKTNMSLEFTISNTFNKCFLHISYNQETISEKWVKCLGEQFNKMLNIMAEQSDLDINNNSRDERLLLKDISLINKNQIELLNSYNNTFHQFEDKPLTITSLYNKQLNVNSNKVGILLDNDSQTEIAFAEYDNNVTKLAVKVLNNKNNKPGSMVGIVSERNEFMIYAAMAIFKSGNCIVPIDPYFPEERQKYVIEDSGCLIILCQNKFKENVSKIFDGEIIVMEEIKEEDISTDKIIFPKVVETDPLFLLYTSGSTGKPKGVLMPHKPVANLILWLREKYPVENERILFINPYTFDMSTWGLYAWAVNGTSVFVLNHGEEKDPSKVAKAVLEKSITTIHIVPSMLAMFLEYVEKHSLDLSNVKLRYIFIAGEILQKHLVEKFHKCFKGSKTELVNVYGPTEAHIMTYFNTNDLDNKKHITVPIGKPIYNSTVLIVDKELRVVPPGITGEILLGGDCLADGYLNKTDLTTEKFIIINNELTNKNERYYRSGDIGRWLTDGNIEFFGRNDFQIKIRGFRVEPDEVQMAINKIPGVKESLVIVKEVTAGDKRLAAYVVYENKDKYDEGFIRNELKKHVADYMIPYIIIGLEKFPLNINGKIDRKMLPEPQLFNSNKIIVTPRNKFEKRIVEIWRKALNINDIGINDNFFDIGGHSLMLIRVHGEIEKETDKKIEVVDLFKYPTIASLSEFLNNDTNEETIINKAKERAENQKKARENRIINSKRKGRIDE